MKGDGEAGRLGGGAGGLGVGADGPGCGLTALRHVLPWTGVGIRLNQFQLNIHALLCDDVCIAANRFTEQISYSRRKMLAVVALPPPAQRATNLLVETHVGIMER